MREGGHEDLAALAPVGNDRRASGCQAKPMDDDTATGRVMARERSAPCDEMA